MFDGNVNNEASFLLLIKPYFAVGKSPSTETYLEKNLFTNTEALDRVSAHRHETHMLLMQKLPKLQQGHDQALV